MKRVTLIIFQILALLLLILLATSTFVPQRQESGGFLFLNQFYHSPLNLALWSLLALSLIVAVVFKGIRSPRQKILHIALAVIIVLFIVDKSTNERFFVTLKEGDTINLANHVQSDNETFDINIKLDRFEIDIHDDEQTPKAYRSYLQIDGQPVELAVNKPLAIGRYRLYQSAFEKHYYFNLQAGNEHIEMTFGDTVSIAQMSIVLDDYNQQIRHFRLIIDDKTQWLPLNSPITLDGSEWSITPVGEIYSSVIEVVQVTGLFWLLLAGIAYLVIMAYDFWKPGKAKEKR